MRLDIGNVHVRDVQFGAKTSLNGHALTIDKGDLVGFLEQDPNFDRMEVELAHPGESCRIIRILDVLEPRYRLEGPNFPGALGSVGLVGEGHTRALKNVLVVETIQMPNRRGNFGGNVFDTSGPATAYTPFGDMHSVVLVPHPAAGVDFDEYRLAVKLAGLRTAVYLAEAAKNAAPDDTQTFELPPVADNRGPEGLPRVSYIFPIHSHQSPTHESEKVFYGSNIHGFMPTVVHPNEILDGALVFASSALTYHAQNHPVIMEMYRRHGKDLWFSGVVLTLAPVTIWEKERNAYISARLAREVLDSNGIISTKIGGGAVDTDLMLMHDRCEEMGMRAALIIMERYPDTGITFVPSNVNTLISPGLTRDAVYIPAVERVIGGDMIALNTDDTSAPAVPAGAGFSIFAGTIAGAISQVGASRLTTYMS
jgi:hypothetical protein